MKKRLKKSTLIKVGIVAFLLLIVVGYNIYLKWDKANFAVDSDAFDVQDSFEEVMEDEYERIDGLKLADEYDKVKNVDIKKDLPPLGRDLQIHKMWVATDYYFILYSISLKEDDESASDVPELDFSEGILHTPEDQSSPLETAGADEFDSSNDEDKGKGKVFDNRLYRGLMVKPDFEGLEEEVGGQDFAQFMDDVNEISLSNASLKKSGNDNNDSDNDSDELMAIGDLTVQMDYSFDDQTLVTIPLEKEVTLGNGQDITFQSLDIGVLSNTLHFEAESEEEIRHLDMDVTWDEHEDDDFYSGAMVEGEEYSTSFSPFQEIPEKLDINIKGVSYIQDDDVQLDIPADIEKEDTSEKIGEIQGVPVYFEGYEDQEGAWEDVVGLNLGWEDTDLAVDEALVLREDLEEQSIEVEDKDEWLDSTAGIIDIENKDGDKPDYEDSVEGRSSPIMNQGNGVTIYLGESLVEDSEEFYMNIERFPFKETFEEKEFHINIPDEYVTD